MYGLLTDIGSQTGLDYYGFSAGNYYSTVSKLNNNYSNYIQQSKGQWKCISDIVAKTFCL
jgi:hypothetical protein